MSVRLWSPTERCINSANITSFIAELNCRSVLSVETDFLKLQDWAVSNPEAFWSAIWDFCGVLASKRGNRVLVDAGRFPGAKWFPESRLNFAENLLKYRDDQPALVSLLENGRRCELSYADLYLQVSKLAASMRAQGIGIGDRVSGYLPNICEAVVAMLATISVGAIWSSCSPDFGSSGVLDRFGQIQPKLLFAADGYYYNGKTCDSLERLQEIGGEIESLEKIVVVPLTSSNPDITKIPSAIIYENFLEESANDVTFEQLPFDHPIYIMYSSGTTGQPKCIVHGAGGTLLQHLKEHQLHTDLKREDVFFYFTTCGWMMWNWLVSGLATGSTLVLYDGSPFANDGQVLLDAIDAENISIFGTSAKYISALEKGGHIPRNSHRLDSLNAILSTGSPLSHESFEYVYRDFKEDVRLSSISGGTDIISCFVGGCPTLPVHIGEIQAPGLGMAVDIWDDRGNSLVGEKGELVCTQPFPSTPIMFWNDEDGNKFHSAYFDKYPGTWAQGDYGEITEHGGFILHGRSDSVLNPGGVRIGTAEIYRQVEQIEEVLESVVIGQQYQDDIRVVLFVLLRKGLKLDEELSDRIGYSIRENTTARHVPAKIIQVEDIPRTRSGKISELAVCDVVHGRPVKNADALANPESLKIYRNVV